MRLRGIHFGPCWDASGVRGFFGEGYWFHHIPFIRRWFDFTGSTRVAKTTTLPERAGNVKLAGHKQRGWFPRCIWISWIHCIALNAVDLSGPGARYLFEHGLLHFAGPFMISFMSVADTKTERLEEFRQFVVLLQKHRLSFNCGYQCGLQINVSCPNTKHDTLEIAGEVLEMLDIVEPLGIAVVVKVNLLISIAVVKLIADHSACDAICCTNSILFGVKRIGDIKGKIDWVKYFGFNAKSPLAEFGGGGLSGKPLLPLVAEWIRLVRAAGIDIPLNVGGGITHPDDVDTLVKAGLRRRIDSIFIDSIAMLRPWCMRATIRRAHELLG